jgi:hypothetical protein
LDVKKISADFGVWATDAEWKKLVPVVITRCSKEATGKFNNNFRKPFDVRFKLIFKMLQNFLLSQATKQHVKRHPTSSKPAACPSSTA